MTQDPIERCLHPVCSALVEVLPHAMDTPISAGGVVSIDGKYLSFEAGRALAKSLGFRSYIDLLFWLSENYGVPFKGLVTWPNPATCAGRKLNRKNKMPEDQNTTVGQPQVGSDGLLADFMTTTKHPSSVVSSGLVSPWRDVSSFSQGQQDRTPRTWQAHFGRFKITLTRHIHHAPDAWVATVDGVFDRREMASKDVREAACQAKAMLQVELEAAISELGANVKTLPTEGAAQDS